MLEVSNLSARYGAISALNGVSLGVDSGRIVSLLGSNGAGKSTLLGCITNSVPCRMSGSIRLEGEEILGLPTDAIISRGLVLVPEGRQLFAELTVEENLRMGAYGVDRGRHWRADLDRVYRLFPRLVERRRQAAATLSGGEQQMVAIGRAMMARPRIVLLDEPSLGLAPLLVREIFNLIRDINGQSVTVLLVEQNARQALRIAHAAYVLEKGHVTASGAADELARDPHVIEAYLGEA
ncbi:MAG: ABC transporter ATP-binding protein [Bradyrhizobiaceae bacterium]|nr:MAG: ABC transporter ATP-binding protein [Bradyrhizobiaceae bacterium]